MCERAANFGLGGWAGLANCETRRHDNFCHFETWGCTRAANSTFPIDSTDMFFMKVDLKANSQQVGSQKRWNPRDSKCCIRQAVQCHYYFICVMVMRCLYTFLVLGTPVACHKDKLKSAKWGRAKCAQKKDSSYSSSAINIGIDPQCSAAELRWSQSEMLAVQNRLRQSHHVLEMPNCGLRLICPGRTQKHLHTSMQTCEHKTEE